jgi:DNA-binding transcriptional LysR family regulator
MDRLNAMSILLKVVETGSFSAASRTLLMPLPTVSRKVAELEAHLKAQLLIRTTRTLTLTSAGAAFVEASRRILEQVGEAESAATGEFISARGELVITAPILFGRLHVLPIVQDFLASYPEVRIRLVLSDRNVHLIDDHVDLAVRIGHLPDSSLVATRVGAMRRVVCGSPAYFAANGRPKRPEDLSAHAAVTFDMMGSGEFWEFKSLNSKAGHSVPIRSRLVVNTAEAAIDAALAGVGLTRVLSYQAAAAVKEGKLEIVLARSEPDPVPVNLLHAGQAQQPLKTRAFLDRIVPRLRERISAMADRLSG